MAACHVSRGTKSGLGTAREARPYGPLPGLVVRASQVRVLVYHEPRLGCVMEMTKHTAHTLKMSGDAGGANLPTPGGAKMGFNDKLGLRLNVDSSAVNPAHSRLSLQGRVLSGLRNSCTP
jgi:hypothetical protein